MSPESSAIDPWPGRAEIKELYESGGLLSAVCTRFGHLEEPELEEVVALCAGLHNGGEIDFLALALGPELEALEPTDFFTVREVFDDAIPKLNGPLDRLMMAVEALVRKGGKDFMATQPHTAFRKWCAQDLGRSQAAIAAAKNGNESAERLVCFALEAHSLVDQALELAERCSGEIRLSAITALSRMPTCDLDTTRKTLALFGRLLEQSSDENFRCDLILATLSASATAEAARDQALRLLEEIVRAASEEVRACCAHGLRKYGDRLDSPTVDLLLQVLATAEQWDEGLLRQADSALARLLDSEHADRAIAFIEETVARASSTFVPSRLELFGGALRRLPNARLYSVLVSWLLASNTILCDWLSSEVHRRGGRDRPGNFDAVAHGLTEEEGVFLCGKAIGYFFLQPVFCASILLSALRVSGERAAESVRGLLFDPLLVNYGGELREYLESIDEADVAHGHVRVALQEADTYQADLASPGTIRELLPSEREEQIYHQHFSDQMRESFRRAERESILADLASKSTVLYGRRSLAYFEMPGGERKPFEVRLHGHGVSFEVPRMQVSDPVGLDYMLRVFRTEKLRR